MRAGWAQGHAEMLTCKCAGSPSQVAGWPDRTGQLATAAAAALGLPQAADLGSPGAWPSISLDDAMQRHLVVTA